MEEKHRLLIQKNYSALVQHSDIDDLLPLLIQKKVFSREMIDKYSLTTETDNLERKRKLYLDIQMRGPSAFSNLITALEESGQNHLANLLNPLSGQTLVGINNGVSTPPKRHTVPFQWPPNEGVPINNPIEIGNVNLSTEPHKICVIGGKQLYDGNLTETYSTHSKNRGVVLIINNIKYINDVQEERRGAEVDGQNLKKLFTQMGLQVCYHTNLTKQNMEAVILDFKSSPQIRNVDMVFVIIMSHGNGVREGAFIIGTNNECLDTSWIEEQFNNIHCKALQNKPKIIIYQICRGSSPDHGVAASVEIDAAMTRPIRTVSDILTAYSSVPGFASHRDIYLGAWYINLFCETMMDEAHRLDVESILRIVSHKVGRLRTVKNTMQTAQHINSDFRLCYVHPKIYMGDDGILRNIFDDTPIE